jgi:hypothetical protein
MTACRRLSGATALVLVIACGAHGQVPDHLQCYRVKDALPRTAYTADVFGLAAAPGCLVKVPAKFYCVEATKTNVAPPPPGAPAGVQPPRVACYKLKCPRQKLPAQVFTDQFGSRALQPLASRMLCAPAGPNPTTTTTTLPLCLDPLTPGAARVVEALVVALAPGGPTGVPSSCGSDPELCCPGGNPQSCSMQLAFAAGDVAVTPTADPNRFDASLPLVVTTPTPLPIRLFGLDCTLEVDTTNGASPTVTVDAAMLFDDHPAIPAPPLTRVWGELATVSGMEGDDWVLGGGPLCSTVSLGTSYVTDVVQGAIADALVSGACLPCGETALVECPY